MNSLLINNAVYGFLIDCCLSLRLSTAKDIERHWQMSPEEAYARGIRSVPSEVENIIAMGACRERFGDRILRQVPGLYQFDRIGHVCHCEEWTSECCCHLKNWRMDFDPQLSIRGIVMPVRDSRVLLIEGLRVFRSAQDARGFVFRLRTSEEQIAA